MSLDTAQATPEQIVEFKQAAADRYTELGVPANVAEQLFKNQLAKVASELDIKLDVTAEAQK